MKKIDIGGQANKEMKRKEENEATNDNEDDEGSGDNKEDVAEISMTDREPRSKAVHIVLKTFSIDKFQVEMPMDSRADLTDDSVVKSVMNFFF